MERDDVHYLLSAANAYLVRAWRPSDVLGSFAGIRVLQNEPGVDPSDVTREWSLEEPAPGLLAPIGGKYSTARVDSAEAVDRVMTLVGRQSRARPTTDRAFPWTPPGDYSVWLQNAVERGVAVGLDDVTARTSALRFGSRVEQIHERIGQRPDLADRLHPELPFCRAEVVHAVEREMARSLDDVLRRRIPLTILARPGATVARDAAELAAATQGWAPGEQRQQLSQLAWTVTRTSEQSP